MNPHAVLHMENGRKIVIELLPEAAPNTVASFIHIARQGLMDHYAIQRINLIAVLAEESVTFQRKY